MKILGISGGTKNGGNDAMCKEALKGAKAQGADIEFIRLWDLDLKNCTGCLACAYALSGGKGNMCVLKDDYDWLLDKCYDADGIVFSIPIFEKGAPGIFKALMERSGTRLSRINNMAAQEFAQNGKGKPIDERIFKNKVVSYMGVGGTDWYTDVQSNFAMHANLPLWKVINNEVFPWSTGIIMQDEKLEKAYEVGVNLAKAAADIDHAEYQGDEGVCPHCHSRNFYITGPDTKAICCNCGIIGDVQIVNNQLKFTFEEEQLKHAHDTIEGHAIHSADIGRGVGEMMKSYATETYKQRLSDYKEFIAATKPVR